MGTTVFKPISFSNNEPALLDKFNTLAGNIQYVYEHMPVTMYSAGGVKKTSGLKVLAGTAKFSASSASGQRKNVYFGGFFSQGCVPVITTAANTGLAQVRMHIAHQGLTNSTPDHTGFKLMVTVDERDPKQDKFRYGCVINWIAVGW